MDTGRKHETLRSEAKDLLLRIARVVIRVFALLHQILNLDSKRTMQRRPGTPAYAVGRVTKNSELQETQLSQWRVSMLAVEGDVTSILKAVSKPALCFRRRCYLYFQACPLRKHS